MTYIERWQFGTDNDKLLDLVLPGIVFLWFRQKKSGKRFYDGLQQFNMIFDILECTPDDLFEEYCNKS